MTPGQPCNECHAETNAASGDNEAPIYWGQSTTSKQFADDIHTLLGAA